MAIFAPPARESADGYDVEVVWVVEAVGELGLDALCTLWTRACKRHSAQLASLCGCHDRGAALGWGSLSLLVGVVASAWWGLNIMLAVNVVVACGLLAAAFAAFRAKAPILSELSEMSVWFCRDRGDFVRNAPDARKEAARQAYGAHLAAERSDFVNRWALARLWWAGWFLGVASTLYVSNVIYAALQGTLFLKL